VGVWCGVLVVSLWLIDGVSVVFRRVFLSAERYAISLGFNFGAVGDGVLRGPSTAFVAKCRDKLRSG